MLSLLTLLAGLGAAPAAAGDTVRIDCGSTQAYRSADGRLFAADQHYSSGRTYSNPAIADIVGTSDDALYRTERHAPGTLPPLRYDIAVPAGDYLVRLHMAELYHGATGGGPGGSGQRVFSVALEGRRVLITYDLHADVGPMTAVVKEVRASIADGAATLDFQSVAGDPSIAAIEVLRLPNGTVPAPCNWTPRAANTLERKEGQCALIGASLYSFGGYHGVGLATARSERYDRAADQWTPLAPMPLPTTHTAAAVDGQTVWILGGYVGNWPGTVTSAVQVYNAATNTWRQGPPLPQPRGAGAAARLGRQLHFFGGVEPDIQTDSPLHFVLDLDNEAAGWRLAAPLPQPRCHLGGATLAGQIYALGGQHGHNVSVQNTALVHAYDPLSDTWTRRADLPSLRSHFEGTVTVLDGRILTVGGSGPYTNYEDVLSYEPGANQWTQICDMPVPLAGASARVLGNELIVTQGESTGPAGPVADTRTTTLSRSPSTVLSFSQPQMTAPAAAGSSTTLRNFLWTLTGTASYQLTPSMLPAWLTLASGGQAGSTDESGQAVDIRVDAAGLSPGVYTATLQATAPGYSTAATTLTVTVTAPTAATPGPGRVAASVFPNPAGDYTILQVQALSAQETSLELRNSLGQVVQQRRYSVTAGPNRLRLDTHALAPGGVLATPAPARGRSQHPAAAGALSWGVLSVNNSTSCFATLCLTFFSESILFNYPQTLTDANEKGRLPTKSPFCF